MIGVMIDRSEGCRGNRSAPAEGSTHLPGRGSVIAYLLQQIEFLSAADGRPAIVHAKLGVDVLGVGTQGAQ